MEDEYMIRNEVWEEAGMRARKGREDLEGGRGRLHLTCLEKRLGRKVVEAELVSLYSGTNEDGSYRFMAAGGAPERPEVLDWI
jgi:hypothetical protein